MVADDLWALKFITMFSKRHYKYIAQILNYQWRRACEKRSSAAQDTVIDIFEQLSNMFELDNDNFDIKKFETAIFGERKQ